MMATLALLVTLLCIGFLVVIVLVVSHGSKIKHLEKQIGSLHARAGILESRAREILEHYAGAETAVPTERVAREGPVTEVTVRVRVLR
jgi:hypothetical protein